MTFSDFLAINGLHRNADGLVPFLFFEYDWDDDGNEEHLIELFYEPNEGDIICIMDGNVEKREQADDSFFDDWTNRDDSLTDAYIRDAVNTCYDTIAKRDE